VSVLETRVGTSRLGADVYIVAVSGELDLHSSQDVAAELSEVVDSGARAVIVDLLGIGFIDSAGLGVLVTAAKAMRGRGGEFVLAADDHRIVRLLEITGLQRLFDIHPSLMEAVQRVVDRRLRH
jgi:anti-sigma B factor antagonist